MLLDSLWKLEFIESRQIASNTVLIQVDLNVTSKINSSGSILCIIYETDFPSHLQVLFGWSLLPHNKWGLNIPEGDYQSNSNKLPPASTGCCQVSAECWGQITHGVGKGLVGFLFGWFKHLMTDPRADLASRTEANRSLMSALDKLSCL